MARTHKKRDYRPNFDSLDERVVPATFGMTGTLAAAVAPARQAAVGFPGNLGIADRVTQLNAFNQFTNGVNRFNAQFQNFQTRAATIANQQAGRLNALLNQNLTRFGDQFVGNINRNGAVTPMNLTGFQNRFTNFSNRVLANLNNQLANVNNAFAGQLNAFTGSFTRFGLPFQNAATQVQGAFNQGFRDFGTAITNRVGTFDNAFNNVNTVFNDTVTNFNPLNPAASTSLFNTNFQTALNGITTANTNQLNQFNLDQANLRTNFGNTLDTTTGAFTRDFTNTFGFNPTQPGTGTNPFFPSQSQLQPGTGTNPFFPSQSQLQPGTRTNPFFL